MLEPQVGPLDTKLLQQQTLLVGFLNPNHNAMNILRVKNIIVLN